MTGGDRTRWSVLAVVSAGQFLTILDLWVVNIALPVLTHDFAPATLPDVSWVISVYAIVLAAMLLPAGRVADGLGRSRCFMAGLAVFGSASLGCALAPALPVLIVCRGLQAAGAAVLMPTSLSLALSVFPARQRGTAVGVWAAVGGVAAGSGPVLGGLLAEWSWRWIFVINVPLVLAALLAGAMVLPGGADRGSPRRADAGGALLVLGAIALTCLALTEATTWPPGRTWTLLSAGLALGVAFVAHIRRHADPVLSPRLFTVRDFSAGAAGLVAYYAGFAAMLLGTTLFLTQAWRYSVLQAAAGIVPGPITAAAVAPFSGIVSARLGTRNTVLAGAALFAAAGAWPLTATQSVGYLVVVLPSMLLWGVANALIQPTLFAAANSAPRAELASGSAVLSTARQIGSALGVAILVAILGSHPARATAGFVPAWVIVLASAVLTALAGLASGSWSISKPRTARRARPGEPAPQHRDPYSGSGTARR
jgi:EmrB/QacA subfamily drug resistance transporter